MPDWRILAVIVVLGAVSYALRAGGFLAASALPQGGLLPRLLRMAPGNLFIAFVAAGIWQGGLPSLVGCCGAVAAMAATKREWAALGAGFAGAAFASALL
jgi:uncharacterized membrane protein